MYLILMANGVLIRLRSYVRNRDYIAKSIEFRMVNKYIHVDSRRLAVFL